MGWQDILEDPTFHAQPQSVKDAVARHYFDRHIASDPSFQAQPEHVKAEAQTNFFAQVPGPSQAERTANMQAGRRSGGDEAPGLTQPGPGFVENVKSVAASGMAAHRGIVANALDFPNDVGGTIGQIAGNLSVPRGSGQAPKINAFMFPHVRAAAPPLVPNVISDVTGKIRENAAQDVQASRSADQGRLTRFGVAAAPPIAGVADAMLAGGLIEPAVAAALPASMPATAGALAAGATGAALSPSGERLRNAAIYMALPAVTNKFSGIKSAAVRAGVGAAGNVGAAYAAGERDPTQLGIAGGIGLMFGPKYRGGRNAGLPAVRGEAPAPPPAAPGEAPIDVPFTDVTPARRLLDVAPDLPQAERGVAPQPSPTSPVVDSMNASPEEIAAFKAHAVKFREQMGRNFAVAPPASPAMAPEVSAAPQVAAAPPAAPNVPEPIPAPAEAPSTEAPAPPAAPNLEYKLGKAPKPGLEPIGPRPPTAALMTDEMVRAATPQVRALGLSPDNSLARVMAATSKDEEGALLGHGNEVPTPHLQELLARTEMAGQAIEQEKNFAKVNNDRTAQLDALKKQGALAQVRKSLQVALQGRGIETGLQTSEYVQEVQRLGLRPRAGALDPLGKALEPIQREGVSRAPAPPKEETAHVTSTKSGTESVHANERIPERPVSPKEIGQSPGAGKRSVGVQSGRSGRVAPGPLEAKEGGSESGLQKNGGVLGFTTSKGSAYSIDETGRTTRNKSDHSAVGHSSSDVGPKAKSDKTYYVSPEASQSAGMLQQLEGDKAIIVRGGKMYPVSWNEAQNKWGIAPSDKGGYPVSETPQVGQAPIELWKSKSGRTAPQGDLYTSWHPGNMITKLQTESKPLDAGTPAAQGLSHVRSAAPAPPAESANPELPAASEAARLPAKPKRFLSKRLNPPRVAQQAVIVPNVKFATRSGASLSGPSYALPGYEEYKLVLVKPSGSKAQGTKRPFRVYEASTGTLLSHPNEGATAQDALDSAARKMQDLGKPDLDRLLGVTPSPQKATAGAPTKSSPAKELARVEARQKVEDSLSVGKSTYLPPQIRITKNGKQYLFNSGEIAKSLGAEAGEGNHWKLSESKAPPPSKSSEPEPLQDAGEKIGGARKDLWRGRGLDLSDLEGMTPGEEYQHVVKPNIWPKPDYGKLIESGTDPNAAYLVKSIYDKLAARPPNDTEKGRRQYLTAVRTVREIAEQVKTPDDAHKLRSRVQDALGIDADTRSLTPQARATYESLWPVGRREDPLFIKRSASSKAIKAIDGGWPATKPAYLKGREIRQRATPKEGEGSFYITKGYRVIQDGLESKAAAEAWLKSDWEKMRAAGGELPERPHLDSLERNGKDVRGNKQIGSDDFIQAFGFRGVEFGNWVASDERQKSLNFAFEALHDLASVLGVSPKTLSLDGRLSIAFGARGTHFAAHYEPGKLVINLSKIRGAGALAHEFAHALDHYFGKMGTDVGSRGKPTYQSDQRAPARRRGAGTLRPALQKAWDDVMTALFQRSKTRAEAVMEDERSIARLQSEIDRVKGYMKAQPEQKQSVAKWKTWLAGAEPRLTEMEKRLNTVREDESYIPSTTVPTSFSRNASTLGDYWKRPHEMLARAFESYVFDKIKESGNKSDYLVHGVEGERFANPEAYKGNPYPTGDERAEIGAAFDHLFQTVEEHPGSSGPTLYSGIPSFEEMGKALKDTGKAAQWTADRIGDAARWLYDTYGRALRGLGEAGRYLAAKFGGGVGPHITKIWNAFKRFLSGHFETTTPKEVFDSKAPVTQPLLDKLVKAIKALKPDRYRMEKLKHAERVRRAAIMEGVLSGGLKGEAAFKKMRSAMAGEYPSVAPGDRVGAKFTPAEREALIEHVLRHNTLENRSFEKQNIVNSLLNLLDQNILPTEGEIAHLDQIFGPQVASALLGKRSIGNKVLSAITETMGASKALVFSADLSATLRQGLSMTITHPEKAAAAFVKQIKAFASQTVADQVDKAVHSGPDADVRRKAGLELTGTHDGLSGREESFFTGFFGRMRNVKGKSPIGKTALLPFKAAAGLVNASERAYVTYLNVLRASVFDGQAYSIMTDPRLDDDTRQEQLHSTAMLINAATGRANIPSSKLGNTIFSSWKFAASRFEYPIRAVLQSLRGDRVGREAARQLIGQAVAYVALAALTAYAKEKWGAAEKLETRPTASMFGKESVTPNTSVDVGAGEAQAVKLIARLASGEVIDSNTGQVKKADKLREVAQFAQGKLAPIPSALWSLISQQQPGGGKPTVAGTLANVAVPIPFQNVPPLVRDTGYGAIPLEAADVLGLNVNTYQPKPVGPLPPRAPRQRTAPKPPTH